MKLRPFWYPQSGDKAVRQAIAFLRILTGAFFLYAGYMKLSMPGFGASLGGMLKQWAEHNPIGFYKSFLEHVAAPNGSLFSALVTYGELAIGLSYVSGFLIPLSTLGAMFLNLNILLAAQHTDPSILTMNALFLALSAAFFWSHAGHYYGFDQCVFRASDLELFKPKGSKKLDKVKATLEKPKKAKKKGKKPF